MKILFISYTFAPAVGGIESAAQILLREFHRLGHVTKIITNVELGNAREIPSYVVHRKPRLIQQWSLAKWADIIYYHNPAFSFWLPMLAGKPCVFSIHTWVSRTDKTMTWRDRVKQQILANYPCIANSRATAAHLKGKSTVIENAYDDEIFTASEPWANRTGAAFVGRLVSDKGVATAITAIAEAKQAGREIPLKIIGSGPEENLLKQLVGELGLDVQVSFLAKLTPQQVAEELNRVKYLLVPSKWEEPFGIVALEGIACGCIPIGTNQGGLVDAISSCGPLFTKDNTNELANWLIRLENEPTLVDQYREQAPTHLKAHTPELVARHYLEVFQQALNNKQT